MKYLIYFPIILGIYLTSCQSDENAKSTTDTDMTKSENTSINTSKFEELAVDPCNLLTKEMLTARYDVSAEDLKLSNYSSSKGKVSWTAYCTYYWKKPNFEEIEKRIQDKMIQTMSSGDTKDMVNVSMNLEKSSFEVGVRNLKIYDDAEKALKLFNQSHTVPEKEDVGKVNEEIDNESKALTEEGKELGKDMVGGIAANLKFDKIDGIGTIAYWDYLDNKLDVLYGTIQIGIVMHISEDHNENVEAAKALAQDIIKQF
jgi:ribosomal protein S24E